MEEAAALYRAAIEAAGEGTPRLAARALRRLAVVQHHRGDPQGASALCRQSHALARRIGDPLLAAEALNVEGGLCFEAGDLNAAHRAYRRALRLGGSDRALHARIEQNLGILANIRGELDQAARHYETALGAYEKTGDRQGCGTALHNLGMLNADRGRWADAEACYARSRDLAAEVGDAHLEALCRLNHSEVLLARGEYERAMASSTAALGLFERIGSHVDKADAYRVIGTVHRETGALALAERWLRDARALASNAGSKLSEAEATRELAVLSQTLGRNQEALALLMAAAQLFQSLDALLDCHGVAQAREKLESTYLTVVRTWAESLESADAYTFGHCERVAQYALAVARALGLEEVQQTTIRLGAYLHDLGKIQVPIEILTKPGRLTPDEFEVIKRHPVWGVELLEGVEFPWDLKPIIRWHHEKYDGTGYPDGLAGDEIPLAAQILGIVDVYDALTTTRSYRAALPSEVAIARMLETRPWWRPDVLEAFLTTVPGPTPVVAEAA